MTTCDDYIKRLKDTLPDLVTVKHLVKLGIFRSAYAASQARKLKRSPAYFQLNNQAILYPKAALIEWLQNAKHDGMQ